MHPEHRFIGELAYRLWQARGCPEGSAEQDWLNAEKQLRSVSLAAEARAVATASDAIDSSLQETFPASDPPASHLPDEPAANAGAKWKAAGTAQAFGRPAAALEISARQTESRTPLTDNAGRIAGLVPAHRRPASSSILAAPTVQESITINA